MVCLAESFQVHPLIPPDGDEVVLPLLIVPDEEVLPVGLRVGQVYRRHLLHVVHRGVFGDLVPDASLCQKLIHGRLVPLLHGFHSFITESGFIIPESPAVVIRPLGSKRAGPGDRTPPGKHVVM